MQGGAQFKDAEGQSPAKCTATLWYREISLTHDSLRERTGLSEVTPQTVHQDATPSSKFKECEDATRLNDLESQTPGVSMGQKTHPPY